MPTRHLSDEQRQRYANFAAAPSPDQLARHFHLDRSDREITDGLRGDHNRLGFALMLGSARCIGIFPGADVEIPGPVTAFLVDQLGLKKVPGLLVERAASWLVVNKVLLPGVSVLERFVGRIRDRAQKRLWKRLVAALDDKQRERIAKLFGEGSESGFAALDALRTVPTQRSSGEFLHHLNRLEAIRAFDLRPSPPKGVPAASRDRLARVARTGKPSAIARPRDAKPYAELLARWRRARRLFFNIATRLEMDAVPGGKAVQEAVRYLAKIADWSNAKMRDAPTAAVPKAWQQHVQEAEGRVADPRAYVFAVIDA
jgi:hypothetical protein